MNDRREAIARLPRGRRWALRVTMAIETVAIAATLVVLVVLVAWVLVGLPW